MVTPLFSELSWCCCNHAYLSCGVSYEERVLVLRKMIHGIGWPEDASVGVLATADIAGRVSSEFAWKQVSKDRRVDPLLAVSMQMESGLTE